MVIKAHCKWTNAGVPIIGLGWAVCLNPAEIKGQIPLRNFREREVPAKIAAPLPEEGIH